MARKKVVQEEPSVDKMRVAIERLYELDAEMKDLNSVMAKLKKEQEELEAQVLETCGEQTRFEYPTGGVIITESVVPRVFDWDDVYRFISRKKAFYLLERRMAVTSYREHLERKIIVPGTEPFKKRGVRLVRGR